MEYGSQHEMRKVNLGVHDLIWAIFVMVACFGIDGNSDDTCPDINKQYIASFCSKQKVAGTDIPLEGLTKSIPNFTKWFSRKSPEYNELRTVGKAQFEVGKKVFQDEIVAVVKEQIKTHSGSESSKKLLELRLDGIQFEMFRDDAVECLQTLTKNSIVLAKFSPLDQTIRVCPQLMALPPETIVSVLGHEIAHSIGPCNSLSPVYKVDNHREKLSSKFDSLAVDSLLSLHEWTKIKTAIRNAKRASFGVFGQPIPDLFRLFDLSSSGLIEQKVAGVPSNDYPFSDILDSLNIVERTNHALISDLKVAYYSRVSRRSKQQSTEISPLHLNSTAVNPVGFDQVLDRVSNCLGSHEEDFADWMSGQVTAKYFAKHHRGADEKLKKSLFSAQSAYLLAFECNSQRFAEEYSNIFRRFELIFKNSDLSGFYGCQKSSVPSAFNRSRE